MWFHPRPDYLKSASPPWRAARTRKRCPRLRLAGHKPSLERLEDRSLPSVVAPLPIPGGFPIPNPFGGPDIHQNLPGPADAPPPVGNEPNSITDFNGFIGVAHFEGTGTDNNGNTLLWDADLRFMTGEYQGVDGNLHHATFAQV